jgi:hypothetical protein
VTTTVAPPRRTGYATSDPAQARELLGPDVRSRRGVLLRPAPPSQGSGGLAPALTADCVRSRCPRRCWQPRYRRPWLRVPCHDPPLPRLGPCGARAPYSARSSADVVRPLMQLSARPCSRPNDAAWCGYPPGAGVACTGCCTSLLYGMTGAGINPVGSAAPPPGSGRCTGLIIVGSALMPVIPRLDRSADLRWSPAEGLLHAALRAGDPHYVHAQGFSSGCRRSSLPARTARFAVQGHDQAGLPGRN